MTTARRLPCAYPFTHFEVNHPNGEVTFCCNRRLAMGNVNDRRRMSRVDARSGNSR